MKIRTDFVTNSSSSSFVGFGIKIADLIKHLTQQQTDDILDGEYNPSDYTKIGLSHIDGRDHDEEEIGVHMSYFTDRPGKFKTYTMDDFKDFAAQELNKEFNINLTAKNISWHEWIDF